MDSIAIRKRAAWLDAVARRLDAAHAHPLTRTAAKLVQIADDIDASRPRYQRFA